MTPRKLLAQRATVAVLKARVQAAIAARDDHAGQAAHDALIRAEMRLWRMEGGPVACERLVLVEVGDAELA